MTVDLLERFQRDLALKGFSPRTRQTYFRGLVLFLKHTKTDPYQITRENIKDYLYYLIRDRNLSPSSLKQARSAIRYFFAQTLSKEIEVDNLPCIKKAKINAAIKREGGIHTLRHSFATHRLESGSGIFQLQKFLGHKHLKTTLIYAHIREENIIAKSPLDFYKDKFARVSSNH